MSVEVEVVGLSKYFGDQRALENVSLRLNRESVTGLLGPNGAGKTTLIKILTGIYRPSSGEIRWAGDAGDVRRRVGYCPQEGGLILELTGWDNLYYYGRLYGLSEDIIRKRVKEILGDYEIYGHLDKKVAKYSGGMKKILAITSAILHEPSVLILDEPTTGLDPNMRQVIWNIILEYKKKGASILLATHYMEEADRLSDYIYLINEGKIIAEGTPEELKSRFGPPTIIEVTLSPETPLEKAISILKEEGYESYTAEDKIRIHADDPDTKTPLLVNILFEKGIKISSLRITRPTLEDVFVKLTGRRLEENE